ncbi:hypothetical protein NFX39_05670 [Fructobacillus sp. W13]|uniref:Uncharacterized protein n=1 Tax=Fructobacillus apis TaxID=2935017 RepID=A0ABT0ZRE5_9LACO|nr:hypothetical protein [Fructobacillus apis]MCO0832566.1 hypothetical protein [Fructobacillus apis]
MAVLFPYLKAAAYIATIAGAIAAYVAVATYLENRRIRKEEIEKEKVKASVNVLGNFSMNVLPMIEHFEDNWFQCFEKILRDTGHNESLHHQNIKTLSVENQRSLIIFAKNETGASEIFNQLDQICIYINHHLVKEDLIHDIMYKPTIIFMQQNEDVFLWQYHHRHQFTNLCRVLKEWHYPIEIN